jgi:hypothetical protein
MEGTIMSIVEDIQRRSAHIHWPQGIADAHVGEHAAKVSASLARLAQGRRGQSTR